MIGKILGQYEVLSALGQGGMGEVYRARDTRLDREVAIKVLPREMSGDPERIARFRREARTLATLQHPNVATIYGFEDTAEARFLVMELVEGEDLSERIAKGPIPVDEATDFARQIAAGLEAAHENSVMHRDLKPANIKITPAGVVKILDFGLARAWLGDAEENVDPAHSPTITAAMTQAGTILGTAAYMSPEQARGKRVDRRADIWAFGVILVEMLRGETLFPGETVSDTLASVLRADIDLGSLPANTPPGLRRLIERCLDRDPANRLRDIGEARIALERPLDDVPVRTTVHTTHRGRMFLIGALAGVILGAVTIAVFGPRDSEAPARQVRLSIPRTGTEDTPRSALSPDGSRLLYVDGGSLWMRNFTEPASREVPGSTDAVVCTWSPDGQWIAWATSNVIYKSRPDGSGRARLCEVDAGVHPGAGGIAWSANGKVLFASGDSAIMSVVDTGGDPAVHVSLEETDVDFHDVSVIPGSDDVLFHPHIDLIFDSIHLGSPRGRKEILRNEGQSLWAATYTSGHIVYTRQPDNAGIWAVPFSVEDQAVTGSPFLAIPDASYPTVSLAGDLVFAPDMPETMRLVRIDRRGNVIAEIGEEVRNASGLSVSPDGTEAAYVVQDQTREVWIVDLGSGQRQRFVYDEQPLSDPSWSSDGERIVYTVGSFTSGMHQEIRPKHGGAAEAIDVRGDQPQLSRDGRYLVLAVWDEHNDTGIGYVDLENRDGGAVVLHNSSAADESPGLSPDGSLLVYESVESGQREIYVTTFPSGDRVWQISREGGSQPIWNHDGTEIYFRSASFPQKMIVGVSTDPVRFSTPRVLFSIDGVGWLNAAADGNFYGLQRTGGSEQGTYEVWLGWAETLK